MPADPTGGRVCAGRIHAARPTIIRDRVEPALRIELAPEDACQFAANTVCLGNTIVMSRCSARLRAELQERGYRLVMTPLPSFHRSGGFGLLPDPAARSQFQSGSSPTDRGCLRGTAENSRIVL